MCVTVFKSALNFAVLKAMKFLQSYFSVYFDMMSYCITSLLLIYRTLFNTCDYVTSQMLIFKFSKSPISLYRNRLERQNLSHKEVNL